MTTTLTTTHEALALDPEAQRLLFTEARTANAFDRDVAVTDEQLEAVFALSRFPPTAMNTNPLRWLVVRSEEARARLAAHMSEGNRAKVEQAPLTVVLAADVDFHEHIPHLFPPKPQMREHFAGQPEARDGMARQNAWLQAGYFLLAARAAGLATGPMGGFDADGVDADLLAGTAWRSILVVNLGVPAAEGAWFDRLPRLDYEDVARTV